MTKILLVEDEFDIAQSLRLFIESQAIDVVHIDDGAMVVEAVKREMPDLIIMDLLLPNKDGLNCTKEIRAFSNVPVIMLTAKVEQVDKLAGLEVGADDYVCKPFDAMELLYRIKVMLKRTQGQISYSAWRLDDETLSVWFHEQLVTLSTLEYSLFKLLFETPERIYSRDQILTQAYPECRDITDHSIDSHVKKIRKKFKDAAIESSPIQSVYGAGYRFSPPSK